MLLKCDVTDFSQQGADFTDPPLIKKNTPGVWDKDEVVAYSTLTIN